MAAFNTTCVRTTSTTYTVIHFSGFFNDDFEVEQFYPLDDVQVRIFFNDKIHRKQ